MALGVTIGAKWYSVLPSGQNGTRCYHRDEMALGVTIGVNWHGAQWGRAKWGRANREMAPSVTIEMNCHRAKWDSVLPSERIGTGRDREGRGKKGRIGTSPHTDAD